MKVPIPGIFIIAQPPVAQLPVASRLDLRCMNKPNGVSVYAGFAGGIQVFSAEY